MRHSGFGTCRCVIPTSATSGRSMTPGSISAGLRRRRAPFALATGSIILPVRHPLHTAKAAASIDQLTRGRFVLGVASGDRPIEFPAFGIDPDERDMLFRENLRVIREVLADDFPTVQSSYGTLFGTADLVPKPSGRLPIMVTGNSRQGLEWIAEHSDGWITYPRPLALQAELAALAWSCRGRRTGRVQTFRPVVLRRFERRPRSTAAANPPGNSRRPARLVPPPRRSAFGRCPPRDPQPQVRGTRRGRGPRRNRPRGLAAT